MNHVFLAIMFLGAFVGLAEAEPYFRLLDLHKPQVSAGAFVSPFDPADSTAGSVLAVITHSPSDGCLLPRVGCIDWSPFMVGYSGGGGHHRIAVGPSANVVPVVRSTVFNLLNKYTKADNYLGLKSIFSPAKGNRELSASIGPTWVISPTAKPSFRIFMGAAWKFL